MPHSYLDGGQPMTAEIATELGYAGPEKETYLFGIALVLLVFILIINFVLAAIKGGSKESNSKGFIAKLTQSSKLAMSMQANSAKRALASLERGRQKAQLQLAKNHGEAKPKARKVNKLAKKSDFTSGLLRFFVVIAILITVAFISAIIIYILYNGVPNLKPQFFELEYNSINLSLIPSLLTTVAMVFLGLLIAGPLGIFAAVFLTEYSRKDNLFIKAIRLAAETLAGIPSIIYGVFGYITFVHLFKGTSLMAGVLTVSIMILPLIMRTAEEAILAVPDTYREGSFGLGAGKLRTGFKIVLPSAAPGILSGVILAIGRVFGETAALMLTSGASHGFGGATLAVHLYSLTFNGNDHLDALFATAVILLIVAVGINALSSWTAKKVGKGQVSTEKTKRKAKAI
jgi:phosphate transport system permease protein